MLTFSEQQKSSKTYMRFSKVFQPQNDTTPKRDKRILPVENAASLLNTPDRKALLHEIQDLSAANSKDYQLFYESLINHFAEFVQLLPDYLVPSQTWLDQQLRIAKTALKMREQFLLVGESLHPITSQKEALWHYVVFSSALLRKVGLLFTHYQVSLCNEQGQHMATWQPIAGTMNSQGNYYKIQDIFTQDVPYAESIHLLLARQLMPKDGFNWIASDKEALMAWLGIVEGEREGGVSHQFIILSEKQIDENNKAQTLLEELFETEKLEALLKAHNITEQELLALLPLLHGIEKTDNELSLAFYEWLNREISSGAIPVNQPNALVQMTPNKHYIIAPAVLALFIERNRQAGQIHWSNLYKNAIALGLNALTNSDITLAKFLSNARHLRSNDQSLTSTLFHKTLHDKNEAMQQSVSTTQDAKTHEQYHKQTVAALNNRGFMLGGLYGSTQYLAHSEKLAAAQEQQGIVTHTEIAASMQKTSASENQRQEHLAHLITQRREELKHTIEKQYRSENMVENKSFISFSIKGKTI